MDKQFLNDIKFYAEAILRREVMESNSLDFTDLADKMASKIVIICDNELTK